MDSVGMTGDWSISPHSTFWELHDRIDEIYCNKTTFTRHPVTMSIVSKNNHMYAIYEINRIYPINKIFNEIHQIYQKSLYVSAAGSDNKLNSCFRCYPTEYE